MTGKESIWLTEYYQCWDATESARRAGYKWPGKQGAALKKKFKDLIAEQLSEHHMTREEVLKRWADQARGNIARFASVSSTEDVEALNGEAAIIKKFKCRRYIPKDNSDPYEDIELELYDAQVALDKIGRHLGLYDTGVGFSEDKPFVIKVVKGVSVDDV